MEAKGLQYLHAVLINVQKVVRDKESPLQINIQAPTFELTR